VKSKLHLNQKVSIQKPDTDAEEFYSSYIIAIEEDTISLATPLQGGSLVLFRVGEEICVYAWPLMFTTKIVERCFKPHPVLVLERPRVFIKDQKRNFVRLQANVPVTVKELAGDLPSHSCQSKVSTHTLDISGGGALILYPRWLAIGTGLELNIFLPDMVKCRGQVRRSERIPDLAPKVRLAVEFVEITTAAQDKIIAFIFKRQRELRERGLL
jgi:c-di-GMP-binding flagellar brake protein YcgR